MRTLLSLAILILLAALPTSAADQTPSPAAGLNAAYERIRDTVAVERGKLPEAQINEKLREIIAPLFDFRELSRRCLGRYWRQASPAQQQEFVDRFSDLLAYTYLKHITRGVDLVRVNRISENIEGERAEVVAVVTVKDLVVTSGAKLLRRSDGWKIYDVSVEGIGLVNVYREEFPPIIRKEGFDGLLARLKTKQDERREKALKESKKL